MATFTNQATLSYNGNVTTSNIVTGEITEILTVNKTSLSDCYFRNRTLAGVLGDDQTVTYSSVNGFVDLGLKLTYVLNPGFSVFLEGKNLINSKIKYFSNTYEPGVNIAAGLYFKL